MKRLIAILLSGTLFISGCAQSGTTATASSEATTVVAVEAESEITNGSVPEEEIPEDERGDDTDYIYEPSFEGLNNEDLLAYVEDSVYESVVANLNSENYFVENVEAVYVSQEYLEEAAYNSRSNIFFGYTLEEIEEIYPDTRYVFTLGDDGTTIVQPLEEYDDTYDKVIKNVAIGTGVILVCVTVSVVTAGTGAAAVSLVFAASAKNGTAMALSSGALGAASAGIITGIQTGDMDEALKAAALEGSEGFKWGAITGAITGGVQGVQEVNALKGATLNGLSLNEAAKIQKETGYPIDLIKQFHNMDEYQIFKDANLTSKMVNGKIALVRGDINLNLVDDFGRTNLERMTKGLSPLDASGKPYELHHIGQKADGSLAILTKSEHGGAALHGFITESEINRNAFQTQKKKFWKTIATMFAEGDI